jgi:hypothetical protein
MIKKEKYSVDDNSSRFGNDPECKHAFWTKRCSVCRAIMETDCQFNLECGHTLRVSYTGLEDIVTSLSISKALLEKGIPQKSKFFWVYSIDNGIASLRTSEHIESNPHLLIVSAFTSSELSNLILRTPVRGSKDSLIEQIGRSSHKPTKLAKLLLRVTKKV